MTVVLQRCRRMTFSLGAVLKYLGVTCLISATNFHIVEKKRHTSVEKTNAAKCY